MGTITLIRHGQASFGKADYDQLSQLGYQQGRELGLWFNTCGVKLDHIITGSLKRHKQTAESCCETLQSDLRPSTDWQTDPGFNEYAHTQMLLLHEPRFAEPDFVRALFQESDHPQREFQSIFTASFARWMSGEHDAQYKETWTAFQQRCVSAFDLAIANANGAKHIAIFTSGGPITAICQHLLQLPNNQVADLNSRFANASLTKVLFQPGRVSLSSMNSYAHFEQQPDAGLITYR